MKELVEIPLSKIIEPLDAARAAINEEGVFELAESMLKLGLLQPILVRAVGDKYEIEAGHRRYLAAIRLNWSTISSIIIKGEDEERLHLERAHENLVREDLNPLDEAKLVYKLVYEDGRGVEATSKMLCKSEGWILARCDILRWPQDLKTAIGTGQITLSVGKELAKVRDDEKRGRLLEAAVKHGATKRVVHQWVEDMSIDRYFESQDADSDMGSSIQVGMGDCRLECRVCGTYMDMYVMRHIWLCPDCLGGVRELAKEVRIEIAKKVDCGKVGIEEVGVDHDQR